MFQKNKKSLLLILIAAMVLSFLTSCGNKPNEAKDKPAETETTETAKEEPKEKVEEDEESPEEKAAWALAHREILILKSVGDFIVVTNYTFSSVKKDTYSRNGWRLCKKL